MTVTDINSMDEELQDGFKKWRDFSEKIKPITPETIERYILENSEYRLRDVWGIWRRYENPANKGINVIYVPQTYPEGQYEDFNDAIIDAIMEISKFTGSTEYEIADKLLEMQR